MTQIHMLSSNQVWDKYMKIFKKIIWYQKL